MGTIALGAPPEVSDPGAQVIAFFKEHRHGARVDAWITTFSALGNAVIVGLIAKLLPKPQRVISILGGTALIIEPAAHGWLWAPFALQPDSLDRRNLAVESNANLTGGVVGGNAQDRVRGS